jgi:hypothetical protein
MEPTGVRETSVERLKIWLAGAKAEGAAPGSRPGNRIGDDASPTGRHVVPTDGDTI